MYSPTLKKPIQTISQAHNGMYTLMCTHAYTHAYTHTRIYNINKTFVILHKTYHHFLCKITMQNHCAYYTIPYTILYAKLTKTENFFVCANCTKTKNISVNLSISKKLFRQYNYTSKTFSSNI